MGHPAKVVRVHASERAEVENHTIIIREEITEAAPLAVDADAAVTAEIADTPEPAAEISSKRERVIKLSTGPYLPITGALPLRFASSRRWPAPLPRTGLTREEATSVATNEKRPDSRPAAPPAETPAEPATTDADRGAPQVVVTTAGGPPPPPKPVPALLTSDIVLGFLDNLPPAESQVSVRFEPALPQGATGSAGLGALSP